MATYRWCIDFSLPGVPIDQPMTLDAISLTPAPRDQNNRSSSNGYLRLDTGQYFQDSEIETQAMSQLERIAMVAAAFGGSTCRPIVASVRLENREELDTAGVRTPLQNAGVMMQCNVIAPSIEETTLSRGYRRVMAFNQEDLTLWLRVARWLWKANSDADPYDRFLALWICFNVLYGRYVTVSQQQGIRDFLGHEIPTETDAAALLCEFPPGDLSSLAASGLTLRTCPIANELQTALGPPMAQPSSRELVKLIFLTIYAARNAIVHEGGVAIPQDREVRVVRAGEHILKPAIMHLFRRRLSL